MSAQKGFAQILIIVSVILLAVIGSGSFFLGRSLPNKPQSEPRISLFPSSLPSQQNQMMDASNQLLYHHAYITFSQDRKTWKKGAIVRKSASVPDLIQLNKDIGKFKKGALLVYF